MPAPPPRTTALPELPRRVFCNRTLNLRSIQVVGCDMDYTLVHYDTGRWERRAYEYMRDAFGARGWPVAELTFQPELSSLGLVMDVELGNLVKANRFGHVRNASHGTRMLGFEEWREAYGSAPIDLADSRWQFMHTLFSLSEACFYVQLVDLLDAGKLEAGLSYHDLYKQVRRTLDATHLEGQLKREILAEPERYVILDEQLPQTLLDLKEAGKRLLLITNSEWYYTQQMMSYVLDRYLDGSSWRELFDVVIVQARKPSFFSEQAPLFRLVDDREHYTPCLGKLEPGQVYLGGHARLVEQSLGVLPDNILYIGDHIFADVLVSKDLLRWRTALIVRELERELEELLAFQNQQHQLDALMQEKSLREHELSQLRLSLLYSRGARREQAPSAQARLRAARQQLTELDQRVAELARSAACLNNQRWGPLMRSGNDKSHLAQQIERYADIYMSRVSNLLEYTPFAYLRAPHVLLPHELDL